MSHFALIENGVVTKVIVAEQEHIDTFETGEWVQTSYNTRGGVHYEPNTIVASSDQSLALRANFAGVGFIYDSELDIFHLPQPYPSWTLDTQKGVWNPPIPKPSNVDNPLVEHLWDESSKEWIENIA